MQHMTAPHDPALASPAPPIPSRAYGVYIGRFEPPHQAHLLVMLEALERVQTLIVVIGSARSARTTKNPWTAHERQEIIEAMLAEAGADPQRLRFVHVRDFLYDEAHWLADVQAGVQAHTGGSRDVALVGHIKDESSYYLRSFPDWEFLPTHVVSPLNATDVRRAYFEDRLSDVRGMVPPAVHAFLEGFQRTPEYAELQAEFLALRSAVAPVPAIRLTVGAVVSGAGQLLAVRRAERPGRGLLTLPGDEPGPQETLLACAQRAVQQAGLDAGAVFGAAVQAQAIFDAPGRSQRGRIVAYVFHFALGEDALTAQPAGNAAAWLPLSEALEHPEGWFEDQAEIVAHFLAGV